MIGKTNVSFGRCKSGSFMGNSAASIIIPDVGFKVTRFWFRTDATPGQEDWGRAHAGMWDVDALYDSLYTPYPPGTHGWVWTGAALPLSLANNIDGSVTISFSSQAVFWPAYTYTWYALGD